MTFRLRACTACAFIVAGCASALHPIEAKGTTAAAAEDTAALYAELRTRVREVEHEPSAERRAQLAVEAVKLGQRCDQLSPGDARCDYGLALALGVQARERPSTAHDGLQLMVERLRRAAQRDPGLDRAGPERVLSRVLVKAPSWPTGPGDAEAGLESARQASARAPDYAPNWLAVAEAADAVGDAKARSEAAQHALELAEVAQQAGDAEAANWARDARAWAAK